MIGNCTITNYRKFRANQQRFAVLVYPGSSPYVSKINRRQSITGCLRQKSLFCGKECVLYLTCPQNQHFYLYNTKIRFRLTFFAKKCIVKQQYVRHVLQTKRKWVMPLKPTEMERVLLEDGWVLCAQKGSHRHYKHPTKPGKVTIPFHKGKEIKPQTEKSIRKQAGID